MDRMTPEKENRLLSVLIVDDEYEIRNGLANYFPWKEIGFFIAGTAGNGEEAIRFLKDRKVDVLLTDIRMPHLDGIGLAKEALKEYPNLQIVFLSAHKDFHYAQEAIKYGVKRYMVKPTKYEEITEVFTGLRNAVLKGEDPRKEECPDTHAGRVAAKVREYIEDNLKTVTLEGAASSVQMNPNYLSRIFFEEEGLHFSEYLMDRKMKKAAEYLLNIEYKTYQVSTLIGYSNPKSFSRSFRKYYGVSPMEYRNNRYGGT